MLRPGDASVAGCRLLQKRIGTSRNVMVQPSIYGVYNDGLIEALSECGPSARGVAVVNAAATGRIRASREARLARRRSAVRSFGAVGAG